MTIINPKLDKITKELLKDLSLAQSYSRGIDYFKSGRVSRVEYIDDHIVANVRGRDFYTTTITDVETNPQFYCTCLFSQWGICKHSIAVGLTIIDDPAAVKAIESGDKKTGPNGNFEKIFRKASREQKDTFLKEFLEDNPHLQNKFETYVLGQAEVEKETSVDEICNEVRDCLEDIDLTDYSRFYDYNKPNMPIYSGYREESEMLYDGAVEEFESLLKPFINKMKQCIADDNIIEAFKLLLGIYEGISTFDEEKVDDPIEIFPDGMIDDLHFLFSTIISEFARSFSSAGKEEKAIIRVAEILFSRLTIFEQASSPAGLTYETALFKPLLTEMVMSKSTADYILKGFKKFKLLDEQTDIVQLKIAEVLGDGTFWLKAAKRAYQNNPEIGKKLLEYYMEHSDKANFIKVAGIIFKKNSDEFDEFIYNRYSFHEDRELHGRTLYNLAIREQDIKYFKEYYKLFGEEKSREFIKQVNAEHYREALYVKLLAEIEDYSEILKFVKKNVDSWDFEKYIKPIINIYPEDCFRIITKKTNKFFIQHTGRRYYQEAVRWLELLLEIKDTELGKKIVDYFENIRTRYKNRSALIDELKKAEIIK